MVMIPSLVPIRIDVFAGDKSLRIVDTLLFDPNVWPIPFPQHALIGSNNNNKNNTMNTYDAARTSWIESNVQLLANEVLADQECLGMGRTARHFTGRVDLWSDTMQTLIADQLRPQLVQVALGTATTARQRPLVAVKRKASVAAGDNDVSDASKVKKTKIDSMEVDTPEKESTNDSARETMNEVPQPPKEAETPENTGPAPAKEEKEQERAVERHNRKEASPKLPEKSQLIPIRIRLLVHGVRIHDDFDWDPCLGMSPLELAEAMGRDLQLSDEAVVALAIDMAEQIHGLEVLPDEEGTEGDEGGPPDRRNATAAWPLEQRVHITNVAHLVAQHRHKPTESN
jgi:hypothetical protein